MASLKASHEKRARALSTSISDDALFHSCAFSTTCRMANVHSCACLTELKPTASGLQGLQT
eukprot:7389169-Lingulodinium_polyedra.AAC.1